LVQPLVPKARNLCTGHDDPKGVGSPVARGLIPNPRHLNMRPSMSLRLPQHMQRQNQQGYLAALDSEAPFPKTTSDRNRYFYPEKQACSGTWSRLFILECKRDTQTQFNAAAFFIEGALIVSNWNPSR
jgi:hypothetical protein